jgi:hypothetical protein
LSAIVVISPAAPVLAAASMPPLRGKSLARWLFLGLIFFGELLRFGGEGESVKMKPGAIFTLEGQRSKP